MMLTTPETITEAKRALDEYLRRERDGSLSRLEPPQQALGMEGGSDTDSDNGDYLRRIQHEARASAFRYIESRSKNFRPARQVDESNPSAVEGYIQALSWLKRKGKSRLKP